MIYDSLSTRSKHSQNINDVKKQLIENFEKIYDWFVDNKLNISFGDYKSKSVATKFKRKEVKKLNRKYGDIQI